MAASSMANVFMAAPAADHSCRASLVSLPYKRTMTAIEESMRSRVAFLSATMIRRPGGGEGRSGDRRGEKRRARMRQFETLEDGVRATENQVKKRIADIIERKWSNTNRGL